MTFTVRQPLLILFQGIVLAVKQILAVQLHHGKGLCDRLTAEQESQDKDDDSLHVT